MVKYLNWPDKWNEWIDRSSDRLRPLGARYMISANRLSLMIMISANYSSLMIMISANESQARNSNRRITRETTARAARRTTTCVPCARR